jgi:tetratricopeptide (TPR) repeat protein
MDREVFRRSTFVEATQERFIFLELDFTFGESAEELQRKARLEELAQRFLVTTFPTVVLADKHLHPFGYIMGYHEGYGVQGYICRIIAAHNESQRIVELSKRTANSTNHHDATAFAKSFVKLTEHFDVASNGDDPLLLFYSDEIKRVLAILPETDESREKLAIRSENQTLRAARNATWRPISEKLRSLCASNDWETALSFVEATAQERKDSRLRLRLDLQRIYILSKLERFEEALALSNRVSCSPELDIEKRRRLENDASLMLLRMGKVDEAIARFDERIVAANQEGDQAQESWLLKWKAQLMLSTDRLEETISVCRASREASQYGSEEWQTATYLLALKLRELGDYEEAVRISSELLEVDPQGWCMLDIAEGLLGLGRITDAAEWIERAQGEVTRLRRSDRMGDQDFAEQIFSRAITLRKKTLVAH